MLFLFVKFHTFASYARLAFPNEPLAMEIKSAGRQEMLLKSPSPRESGASST